ncbi:hypothetical protein Taro_048851 [Colocasia esculenta]|uniref:Delta(3)-Delta(2)-enoyl-CoA isomerase n=1 Tax=Colocasia esculenta TaxID=4460 RepID=A0A843X979_COLES|nr:hypothetical protein [Colocasia esculenta]
MGWGERTRRVGHPRAHTLLPKDERGDHSATSKFLNNFDNVSSCHGCPNCRRAPGRQVSAVCETAANKKSASPAPTMCSLEKRGRVYVLTLTGDGEHRFSPVVIDALRSTLARVRSEATADPLGGAALVTAGEGKFFSNGFDLAWANEAGSPDAARARLLQMVTAFAPVVADMLSLPMPTIAAVTGHAAAAGMMLALSHDHVLMKGDRAVLYMSELDIGLNFPDYFMALMRSKIGDPRALRDVALRAAKIKAAEAVKMGIIDGAYPTASETMEAALQLGEKLAGRKWDGQVYASIRKGAFPELCKAVGVEEEEDEEKRKVFTSRL